MARKPLKKNNYVDRTQLKLEIEKSFEQDELTKEAWKMLILMTDRISRTFSYKYPEDRDDCKATALGAIHRYWRNYDKERSPYPFSYFTSVIFNGLRKGFNDIRPKSTSTVVNMTNEQLANL